MKTSTRYIFDIARNIGRPKIAAYCALLIFFYSIYSLQPYFLSQFFSFASEKAFSTCFLYLILVFFSFLATSILAFLNNNILQSVRKHSKDLIWKKISRKGYFYFIGHEVGDVQNLTAEASFSARALQYESLQLIVRTSVLIVTYSVILGARSILLSLVYIALYVLYFWLSIVLSKNNSQGIDFALNSSSRVNSFMVDFFRNIETVISFKSHNHENTKFESLLENERSAYHDLQKRIDISHFVQQVIISIISIAVITVGLFKMRTGHFDMAILLIIVYSAFNLNSFGKDFLSLLEHRDRMESALRKLGYEIKDDTAPLISTYDTKSANTIIEVRNLSFAYDGKKVLDNVSLAVKVGEKLTIIGQNGSGKSTLLKLIGGIISPVNGNIIYSKEHIPDLSKIRYFSQSSNLFDRSIYENIIYPLDECSKERVFEIIKMLSLESLIATSDDLMNRTPGDFGARFSGGEKQKILIARAMINKVPVMLFDELTSSLDRQTEEMFARIIADSFRDCTIINVTHKSDYLGSYDRILKMSDLTDSSAS